MICLLISLIGYTPVDNDLHLYMYGKHVQLFYKDEHIVGIDDEGCLRADIEGVDLIQYHTFLGKVTVKPDDSH